MSRLIILALVVTVSVLSACKSKPTGGDGFRTLAKGYTTGLGDNSAGRVAHNAEEWRKLWDEHTSTQLPRPPAPEVDFSREMVVCVLSEQKPSGGYGIEVVGTRWTNEQLVVVLRTTEPAADAVVPMVVTRPYHMIATPRTTAAVKFEKP
jgi:hypothetical protein